MRIFSSAEYCLWVARRMSLIICSVGAFPAPDFCLIFAPLKGYDEPEILRSQLSRFGPISADAGHSTWLSRGTFMFHHPAVGPGARADCISRCTAADRA